MKTLEMEDFLQYKYLSGLNCSPDGRTAAWLVRTADLEKNGYNAALWIQSGDEQKCLAFHIGAGGFCWEDETHLLYHEALAENKNNGSTRLNRVDVVTGEASEAFILPFAASEIAVLDEERLLALSLIDAGEPDAYRMSEEERNAAALRAEKEKDFQVIDELPYRFNGRGYINKRRNALFTVDRSSGTAKRISGALQDVNSYAVMDGKLYYCAETFQTKMLYRQDIFCYDPALDTTRCLYDGGAYQIEYLMPFQGALIFAGGTQERYGYNENPMFYRVDTADGTVTLFSDNPDSLHPAVASDCRLGRTRLSQVCGDQIYYLATRETSVCLMRMDAEGNRTEVIGDEGSVDDFAVCPEMGGILVVGMYDNRLQELYAFDCNGQKRRQISDFNTEILEGKYVASCERIRFPFADYELDGWVLCPADYDPEKTYPAILDIHGGPKMTYGETFYHEMQVWANRGYFVFYCNPVGSDGRGNDFVDMRGKYGTVDYDSLMCFTDTVLARYPQIDPNRLAVTGGSYGGYMTNWMITHTNRFACAASQRSITNWLSFYGTSDLGYNFNTDQMAATPFDGPEQMWNASPLKYAANAKTPTLFIHSDEDYRCPLGEGLQLYTALVDHGVPARMCIFKGENHELSRSGRPRGRLRRLQEITAWIEHYTKSEQKGE
ncbi:MAG: S9 family peptidase [Clostridiales bacterium]|nr:S9 family peptidase [Clostridiales bacterium]